MPLSWTLDKIGPMCRTAEDCGHVLHAIAGKDDMDPGSAGKSFYFAPQYSRDIKSVRIGYAPYDFEQTAEPDTRSQFAWALDAIRKLGVQFREVSLANLPCDPVTATIIGAEAASVFEELIESGRVNELADAKQIAELKASLDIASRDYLRAMRIRRLIQAEFQRVFRDVDLLIAPARTGVAPKISEPLDRPAPPARDPMPAAAGLDAIIPAGNLAGLPALSLPCGLVNGLPIGIQIVGRPFSENLILKVGMEFQKTTDWHRLRPKMAS
jgi:aspartyl-tRNA(Asn)/glutamyl-tRNA(Gln) amidotransferase subunit A